MTAESSMNTEWLETPGFRMRLADIGDGCDVLAEGEFACLGKADDAPPDALAFCESQHYIAVAMANPNVSAILARREDLERLQQRLQIRPGLGIALVDSPRAAFWRLHNRLAGEDCLRPHMEYGVGTGVDIHPTAIVSERSRIGDGVRIGPGVVVEDYSIIGDDCVLGPGAVVGTDGLETFRDGAALVSVRHVGGVRLGRAVHLRARSVIARAVRPRLTVIGDECAISIQASVGPECRLGRACQLSGNARIGGSVQMGDYVWVGPSATVKDGLRIGDNAQIKIGSVVIQDVAAGASVSGNFAMPHRQNLLAHARAARQ